MRNSVAMDEKRVTCFTSILCTLMMKAMHTLMLDVPRFTLSDDHRYFVELSYFRLITTNY